ncbi:MAG: enoyl-CoA hydratase/isomerase family protein [Marinosulfonomonas sp.]|nr:enoyl-CoA hydratase/isomerase family protein [Marinosulfonomonas sp.]
MSDINIRITGRAGRITLNRPKALNALSHAMVRAIDPMLVRWAQDPEISIVLMDAVGDRAFCAGGDVADLYAKGRAGNFAASQEFWHEEYLMNARIANFPKPLVVIMDGIAMGGGVGLSAHASHRVVTERTVVAMPECAIGLIPDVGGSYVLARSPGHSGEYLALTGNRMDGADCIYAGFADCLVKSDGLAALKSDIFETGNVAVLEQHVTKAGESRLAQSQDEIDAFFTAKTLGEVFQMLAGRDDDWARSALKKMNAGAPVSMLLTFDLIRQAREMTKVEQALIAEFRLVTRCSELGEFLEGVRAAIIDKDRSPKWKYPTISDVPGSLLAKMKSPAEPRDLEF